MDDKNEIMIVDERSLRDRIYAIRGQQVMLDFDLAEIYGYTTKVFNQQIKRNADRFPEDFMFQLTRDEVPERLKSQNVTLNESGNKRGMHIKKLPYAFTEQGIYMLMTVLKGDLAVEQSKALVRLFKQMKDYIAENRQLLAPQNDYLALAMKVSENTNDIREIKDTMLTKTDLPEFMKLFDQGVQNEEILILDGQPFKADLAYQKLYRSAKKSIVIIDDYIGAKTLQHLVHAREGVALTIVSDNRNGLLKRSEYEDFITEYPKRVVTFLKSGKRVHDRYIILDHETDGMRAYHCGASSKDAGKRITTITRLMEVGELKRILRELLEGPPLALR